MYSVQSLTFLALKKTFSLLRWKIGPKRNINVADLSSNLSYFDVFFDYLWTQSFISLVSFIYLGIRIRCPVYAQLESTFAWLFFFISINDRISSIYQMKRNKKKKQINKWKSALFLLWSMRYLCCDCECYDTNKTMNKMDGNEDDEKICHTEYTITNTNWKGKEKFKAMPIKYCCFASNHQLSSDDFWWNKLDKIEQNYYVLRCFETVQIFVDGSHSLGIIMKVASPFRKQVRAWQANKCDAPVQ